MSIEQRANIKFCLKKVYGDDCLFRSRIHEWFKRFQEGWEALKDDERSGRQRNVVNEENAEIVHQKRAEIITKIHGIGIRNIRCIYLFFIFCNLMLFVKQ